MPAARRAPVEPIAELKVEQETSDVQQRPDGTIQSGRIFVRRCDPDGKERWRVRMPGWVGRITLR